MRRGGIDGLMVAAGVGIGFMATLASLIVGVVVVAKPSAPGTAAVSASASSSAGC